ncbi:EI24 domain-containing protein [Bdellovibrio sp. NC01]|uniref:EI24 domain-containing protein n=1 Tax=Bdellovibrio sp. NC01 TaxID=2220073 RepID=UPI00115ADC23|nr:EI24 domain-containing protein [Bdellovibrio sp. NC01]QDK37484.1 hypothetical protein DOE51_07755 [Bdellovibrio sp. NC01]
MTKILQALRQSFEALLSLRMFLLVIVPPFVAVLCVLGFFFFVWNSLFNGVSGFLHGFGWLNWIETSTGSPEILSVVTIIFLVLMFIPLAYLCAVLFTSIFVMPIALKWISESEFKDLEKKRGGSTVGSVWNAVKATIVFVVLFFVTLPLWFLPGCQVLIPLLLTSWLNKKVFMYDVLQDFATAEERAQIEKSESHTLWGMGLLLGLMAYIPLAVFILPVFSALSYSHYALNELRTLREPQRAS